MKTETILGKRAKMDDQNVTVRECMLRIINLLYSLTFDAKGKVRPRYNWERRKDEGELSKHWPTCGRPYFATQTIAAIIQAKTAMVLFSSIRMFISNVNRRVFTQTSIYIRYTSVSIISYNTHTHTHTYIWFAWKVGEGFPGRVSPKALKWVAVYSSVTFHING